MCIGTERPPLVRVARRAHDVDVPAAVEQADRLGGDERLGQLRELRHHEHEPPAGGVLSPARCFVEEVGEGGHLVIEAEVAGHPLAGGRPEAGPEVRVGSQAHQRVRAVASAPRTGTTSPSMSSCTASRMPPASVVTTARPQAMASSTALEMPSDELVCTNTSAAESAADLGGGELAEQADPTVEAQIVDGVEELGFRAGPSPMRSRVTSAPRSSALRIGDQGGFVVLRPTQRAAGQGPQRAPRRRGGLVWRQRRLGRHLVVAPPGPLWVESESRGASDADGIGDAVDQP